MFNLIIENKEIIKPFYGIVIGLICLIIVLKTDRLFRISLHQGIRYFRNAFLFFGIGFVIRYLLGALFSYEFFSYLYYPIFNILFEYFLIMAGFFLIYSLLWKKLETSHKPYRSSLLNIKIIVLYIMAFVLVFLDYIWQTYSLMFFSQIVLFVFASVISLINYLKNGEKYKFLKFYFLAMLLTLSAWTLNALALLYFNWNQNIIMSSYILNIIIFLLFLYGVVKITKK